MLPCRRWELLHRLHGAEEGLHDFHEVVAQVHGLVKHGVVRDQVLWQINAELLAEVQHAGVALRHDLLPIDDVGQVDADLP